VFIAGFNLLHSCLFIEEKKWPESLQVRTLYSIFNFRCCAILVELRLVRMNPAAPTLVVPGLILPLQTWVTYSPLLLIN
jgi:hypothetical protein